MQDNISIRKATLDDLEEIYDLINNVFYEIEDKDWFSISKNIKTYENFIKNGCSVVSCYNNSIIGCFLTHITQNDKDGLFNNLNYSIDEINETIIMDTCAVSSKYRGRNLQYRMLLEIENMLNNSNIRRYISTVHPHNLYSLNNFLKSGYQIKVKTKLYGGLERYILEKII